jgi:hypothetical protein
MGQRTGLIVLVSVLIATALGGSSVSQSSESDRIRDALKILVQVPAGRNLVALAMSKWQLGRQDELLRYFRWDDVSRTDAVLTRHYDPATGKETRDREVTIYIRRGQKLQDLVFDIAHELTHATGKPGWDPYDPTLTAAKYIHASIEGSGGEVDALTMECQVGLELSIQYGISASRCSRYRGRYDDVIHKERIVRDFYRVGKWRGDLLKELGSQAHSFPYLSSDDPELYSSTGQAPYPVALLREFQSLNQTACENTRRRLELDRSPASSSSPAADPSTRRFLANRCGGEQPARLQALRQ